MRRYQCVLSSVCADFSLFLNAKLWLRVLVSRLRLCQVSSLEKKVAELENEILMSGDLKSKLKQENTQLVHR